MNQLQTTKWVHAQEEELACWTTIGPKLRSEAYCQKKREYWRRILAKIGLNEELAASKVLEVGCGPSGLFIVLPDDADITLLDPLLDQYKEVAPHLLDGRHRMVSQPLEKAKIDGQYEIIFAINCIDHCEDIELFLGKLKQACAKSGRVFLAVNTHLRRWTEQVWQRAQPLIEPHHPYHFTEASYLGLFSKYFRVERVVDIEDEVIWVNNETRVMQEGPPLDRRSSLVKVLDKMRSGEILGALLVKILAGFGLPQHDFRGTGNSIYRHKLFVLRPTP